MRRLHGILAWDDIVTFRLQMLRVNELKREVGDRVILTGISFSVSPGDILFVRGPSGVGKSLLLRAVAFLDPFQGGELSLDGKSPEVLTVPTWRARVTYVPQSRVQPRGTPSELYYTAQRFAAQRGRPRGDLPALVHALGLEQLVLNQPWTELSGGQAQRVTLAICLALKPEFLLLDEPTSALDQESALKTEQVLKESGAGLIWVTHDDSQPARVGGRVLSLPLGTEMTVEQGMRGANFEDAKAALSPDRASQLSTPAGKMGATWLLGAGVSQEESLSFLSLLASILLMLVNLLLSVQLSLGLHKAIIIATCRCVVQLMVLAYILAPAFALDRWWLTLIYFIVMLLVSSMEVVSRPSASQEGFLTRVIPSLGGSSVLVMAFGILLVLRPRPWYNVHTILPSIGMLLSSMVSGVSLGLSTAVEELTAGREKVELLLSVGASRREATKSALQRSVSAALTPALNQMTVIGLVSLPEFMSGQLVSGTAPSQAAALQVAIILLAFTATALATVAAVYTEVLSVVDSQHRLRAERLVSRRGREAGVAQWIHAQTVRGWKTVSWRYSRLLTRVRVSVGQRGYRHRDRAPNWLLRSPLGQRVFRGQQGEEEDGSLDSVLRGAGHGLSDDEQESTFSGVFSETEEGLTAARSSVSAVENDNRQLLLTSPRRSEP